MNIQEDPLLGLICNSTYWESNRQEKNQSDQSSGAPRIQEDPFTGMIVMMIYESYAL